MDAPLSQLRDIRGIDAVSWWPPAPGWWVLAGLIVLAFIGVWGFRKYRHTQKANEARRVKAEIKALFDALRTEHNGKKKAAALSELLRLLAIRQYGRHECAGLEGTQWLAWLSTHDPDSFDWAVHGKILLKAPYAPDDAVAANDLAPLVSAAERWVR